jgi:two-component system response regulator
MDLESKMILLVEDNPDDEALTLRAFKKNNFGNKISIAHDGVEALDFLFCTGIYADRDPHEMPHVVLLDLNLPKVGGLEVLRRIRADKRTHTLPVVILTSSKEERDLAEGYEFGANSYVRKPVDFNEFIKVVGYLGLYWLVLNNTPPLR